jgi:hypothetical protein
MEVASHWVSERLVPQKVGHHPNNRSTYNQENIVCNKGNMVFLKLNIDCFTNITFIVNDDIKQRI